MDIEDPCIQMSNEIQMSIGLIAEFYLDKNMKINSIENRNCPASSTLSTHCNAFVTFFFGFQFQLF